VLFGDTFEHAFVDEPLNQAAQRLRPQHLKTEKTDEAADLRELGRIPSGQGFLQARIVFRSEKRKRRNQRSGADPGHDAKLWAGSRLRPADQNACPKCAVGPATRQREHRRPNAAGAEQNCAQFLTQDRVWIIAPKTGIRYSGNSREGLLLGGKRDSWRGRARTDAHRDRGKKDCSWQ
jgi:hypothetical protein